MVDIRGSLKPKISRNITLGISAFSDNRSFLTSTSLTPRYRVIAHQSLVLSRFLYHLGLMPTLPKPLFIRFNAVYTNLWHNLFNNNLNTIKVHGKRLTNKQLFQKHRLIPLEFVLRKLRISQFIRVVRYSPPFLRALLQLLRQYPTSWISTVISDLTWIQTNSTKFEWLTPPSDSLADWLEQMHKYPTLFINAISLILKDNLDSYYDNMPDEVCSNQPVTGAISHQCTMCPRVFKSLQGVTCHLARTHDIRHPIDMRIINTKCPNCDHVSLYRYLNILHIKTNPPCKQYVMENILPVNMSDLKTAIVKDNLQLKSNVHKGLPRFYAFSREG
jgi:hypothetical protein